jgi:hypothetical protein
MGCKSVVYEMSCGFGQIDVIKRVVSGSGTALQKGKRLAFSVQFCQRTYRNVRLA